MMESSVGTSRVTVVISARNRADELLLTLRQLKTQVYPDISLIVVDDASEESLEAVVRSEWPHALFLRNEVRQGLIANRSKAMKMADTEFIVSLDDDSCFTNPTDLATAVSRMEAEPRVGVITFFVYHGHNHVPARAPETEERYTTSFIGCAHMIRSSVVTQIGGYRDFYFYYGEESEYSLRVWDAGWRILFMSRVLVHHRVSLVGRRRSSILRYSIRNNLWTTILHMPWPRVAIQLGWRMFSYGIESLRLGQPWAGIVGFAGCLWGLPTVLRLRRPIRRETLAILDLLATTPAPSPAELSTAVRPRLRHVVGAFFAAWRDRPRARSFWDRRPGDVGKGSTSVFEHELKSRGHLGEGK